MALSYDPDEVHRYEYRGYIIHGPTMRYKTYDPFGTQVRMDAWGTGGYSLKQIREHIDTIEGPANKLEGIKKLA